MILKVLFLSLATLSTASCVHTQEDQPDKDKIVLVHGFGRSPSAMQKLEEYFTDKGFLVYNIGYSSLTQDMNGVKNEFYTEVDKVVAKSPRKIHFVGHSLGGLLIRSYLDNRNVKQLGNVVTIGSPNKGTPLVETLKDKWYASFAGPAVKSLSSKGSPFLTSLNQNPKYNLGVIAGYADFPEDRNLIEGQHDGVVPVSSTVVDGAKDYLLVPVPHYAQRSNRTIMRQALNFLQKAKFDLSHKG